MSDQEIFKTFAPIAWAKGLAAAPVPPGTKQSIASWDKLANHVPDALTRERLVKKYPDHGIALPMNMPIGGGYNVIALDFDQPLFLQMFKRLGFNLISGKVGQKGETWFFKSNDAVSRAINTAEGRALDILAARRLCVIDPTLHPETGQPYRALGTPILEIEDFHTLPEFTNEHGVVLEAVIKFADYETIATGKSTHDAFVKLMFAIAIVTDNEDLACQVAGAIPEPDYAGDELKKLPEMFRSARKKVLQNDPFLTGKKNKGPTPADKLIEAVMTSSRISLFHNSRSEPYIVFQPEGQGKFVYPLNSGEAKLKLGGLYYETFGRAIPTQDLKDALNAICAKAIHDSPEHEAHLRIAGYQDKVIVDLADDEARIVIIDKTGIEISHNSPIMFARVEGLCALPLPSQHHGDAFVELQKILSLSDETLYRVIAFAISCYLPLGPYLILLLEGEQGSGKSFLSELLKLLIDPGFAPKLRLPDSERDLMIMANNIYLLVFDNMSSMRNVMSDALCALSTGGGFATRKLYKDAGLQFFFQARPMIANGISGIAERPDLLERSLSLKLKSMPEGQRKTEAEMREQIRELLPRLQGKLYSCVSQALANKDSVIEPKTVRMADAANWLVAAEPGTGFPAGTLLRSLEESQNEIISERMESNSVAIALHRLVDGSPFCNNVGNLLSLLKIEEDVRYDRFFPQTAAALSRELHKLRPALEKAGIIVEFGKKDREGRKISIWLAAQAENREAALKMMAEVDAKRKF